MGRGSVATTSVAIGAPITVGLPADSVPQAPPALERFVDVLPGEWAAEARSGGRTSPEGSPLPITFRVFFFYFFPFFFTRHRSGQHHLPGVLVVEAHLAACAGSRGVTTSRPSRSSRSMAWFREALARCGALSNPEVDARRLP